MTTAVECSMSEESPSDSRRVRLGILLLAANTPVGLLSMALFSSVGAATSTSELHLFGLLGYAFSWLMLVAGLVMAGPAATRTFRRLTGRSGTHLRVPSLDVAGAWGPPPASP